MVQHRDEHRRYATEGVAPLRLDGLQRRHRIERFTKVDDGDAAQNAGDAAQYHAADVIERERVAEPLTLADAGALGEEHGVVEQPVMGQRGGLG